nr:glycosyltransferase [Desulfobulbus alkaliphilus]
MVFYLEANPTVADAWPSPLRHYVEYGAEEGCRPNRLFDPAYYRRTYLDAHVFLLNAFLAYLDQGLRQGHRPNPLFDPVYYGEHYLSATDQEAPLLHYLRVGRGQGSIPCAEIAALARKPVISILTPVFNTDAWLLRRCVHSVMYQPYPFWELCLVDDGSVDDRVRGLLEDFAGQDERIRIAILEKNQGIAAATNAAADLATGEYLAFLDHDDELDSAALYQVALAINDRDPDVLYSDEDLINMESRHLDTFYKPGFNRELLLNHNYITHLLVTRRSLFTACGGLDSAYNGAQDYDLTLKLTEKAGSVTHIPQVLYHWRAHETSTSINHGEKHYADEAGRRAVQAAMERRGITAKVTGTELRFFYRPGTTVAADVTVTIILDQPLPAATGEWMRNELAGQWPGAAILAPEGSGEQGGTQDEQGAILHSGGRQRLLWRNQAARQADSEYLCFLGEVVWPSGSAWLHALLEYGQAADAGMIGVRLDRQPDTDLHRGSLPDVNNTSPWYWASFVRDVSVQHNGIHCPQNVLAVDAEMCLLRRSTFLDLGGYDQQFAGLDFAQIDLCFRLHAQHLANVFTPWCSVTATGMGPARGDDAETAGDADRHLLQQRWRALLRAGDPYYNRQLLVDRGVSREAFLRWYAGEGD